jgi:pyruvate/2-oxoglutarate dehydrogenase complex dihydrolipoamide dehydrogenase (E3) component
MVCPVFPGPLLVMGAGSVGGFVGGCLQAAGAEVHLVARPACTPHSGHRACA